MPNLRYTARGRPQILHRRSRRRGELRLSLAPWRSSIYSPWTVLRSSASISVSVRLAACDRCLASGRLRLAVGVFLASGTACPKPRSSSRGFVVAVGRWSPSVMFIPCGRVNLSGIELRETPAARTAPGCSCRGRRRPSGFSPRKSRTRGRASEISRSRNSYIRWPRSVTLQPIGHVPRGAGSRRSTCGLCVTTGFWPVICVSAADGLFEVLLLGDGAADAHVDDDLLQPRQRQRGSSRPSFSASAGRISFSYRSCSRGVARPSCFASAASAWLVSWSVAHRVNRGYSVAVVLRRAPCGGAISPIAAPHFLQNRSLLPSSQEPGAGPRAACRRTRQTSSTFEIAIGISFDSRPPCGFFWLRRTCLYTRLTPSTTTLPVVAVDPQHLAAVAAVVAGDHFHRVVHSNVHHTTSLARLTIFMKFRSRSSRATAPKMRVPRGILVVVDDHHRVAVEADVAAVGAAGRLLAADDHRPHDRLLLDVAAGDHALDAADDDVAQPGRSAGGVPPSTLMHITSLAPVLSATASRVCIWIMVATYVDWRLASRIGRLTSLSSAVGRFGARRRLRLPRLRPRPASPPRRPAWLLATTRTSSHRLVLRPRPATRRSRPCRPRATRCSRRARSRPSCGGESCRTSGAAPAAGSPPGGSWPSCRW